MKKLFFEMVLFLAVVLAAALIISLSGCITYSHEYYREVDVIQKPYSSSHKWDGFWSGAGRMIHDETGGRQ